MIISKKEKKEQYYLLIFQIDLLENMCYNIVKFERERFMKRAVVLSGGGRKVVMKLEFGKLLEDYILNMIL